VTRVNALVLSDQGDLAVSFDVSWIAATEVLTSGCTERDSDSLTLCWGMSTVDRPFGENSLVIPLVDGLLVIWSPVGLVHAFATSVCESF
jgi:hypothetical protein